MKEKFVVVCAVSMLTVAASLAAFFVARAGAAEPAAAPQAGGTVLKIVAEDSETRIYSFRSEDHLCFVASTRGGSGVSMQCPR